MRNVLSGLSALVALTFGLSAVAPSAAAPAFAPATPQAASDTLDVQYNQKWRRSDNRVENRMDRGEGRFERRGNRSYYNGHRGYDHQRRGYRQHNGAWFPAAAFIAGAILGGAIDNPPAARGRSHAEWCSDRYRSYRASDNTFQPNNGPRKQCVSS